VALILAAQITGDFSNLVRGAKETGEQFNRLSADADKLAREARDAAGGLSQVEREAKGAGVSIEALQQKFRRVQPGDALQLTAAEFKAVAEEAKRSGRTFEDVLGGNRDQLDAMRAAHDPLFAAQRRYLDQLASIRAAEAAGALPREQARAALARTKAEFAGLVPVIRSSTAAALDNSKAVQLQRWQLINLGQQVQDVGVQLAMGMNPAMILAQQGPQIVSATGGFRNFGALVRQYVTPARIAVGGLTTALATGAAAWSSYLGSTKPVETALAGVGRRIGRTRGEMEVLAQASAEAGEISVRSAREMEVAYLRAGRIPAEVMQQLIVRTKDFAATLGVSTDEARDMLAEMFGDPEQGVEKLNKAILSLSDAELQAAKAAAASGDSMSVQLLMLQALDRGTVDYGESVTALGRAWDFVARGASDAWDAIGGSIDRGFSDAPATEAALKRLIEQRDRLLAFNGPDYASTRTSSLANLNAEIGRMRTELGRAQAEKDEQDANEASVRAGEVARRYTPDYARLASLRGDRKRTGAALADPSIRENVDALADLQRAYDATGRALETYLTPAERVTAQHRLDLQALAAKTPAEKAAIAAERERLQVAGEALPPAEASARIEAARAKAFAEATHEISEQNREMSLNARLTLQTAEAWLQGAAAGERAEAVQRGLTDQFNSGADAAERARVALADQVAQAAASGAQSVAQINAEAAALGRLNMAVASGAIGTAEANRQMQQEAQLRPLIAARDNAEGAAKEVLTRIIDGLTEALARYNAETARAAALTIEEGQQNEIELLRMQGQMLYASASARESAIAVRRQEIELTARGISLTSDEAQAILANTRIISDMTLAYARDAETREMAMRTTESALERFNGLIAEGKFAAEDWGNAVSAVVQDVAAQLLRLAATAPIMNSLFGTNYATISDVGGIIGSFFHDGGEIGSGGKRTQLVPRHLVARAPRFHDGGRIGSNERVVIAEVGEEMLTADDPRHIKNIRRMAGTGGGSSAFSTWAGEMKVEFHLHEGPGVKSETRETRQPDGSLRIDTMVSAVEAQIAGRVARGQSDLNGAFEKQYGLRGRVGG